MHVASVAEPDMELPLGRPLQLSALRQLGASYKQVEQLVLKKKLFRLGLGVYTLAEHPITLPGALQFLSEKVPDIHIAGISALRQGCELGTHAGPNDTLVLWGNTSYRLPAWLTCRFPARLANPHLFAWEEWPGEDLAKGTLVQRPSLGLNASTPERAILECLYEAEVKHDLQLAIDALRVQQHLSHERAGALLQCCRSVKTVRLFLKLTDDFDLLDVEYLRKTFQFLDDSAARWSGRLRNGQLLTLKAPSRMDPSVSLGYLG